MQAGKLDQRVTLQSATLSKDAVGGPVETWADVATVWANVFDLTGAAIVAAQQVGSRVNRRVTIRHRAGVSSAMRVKFSDGRLAKVAFVRVPDRAFIELHCEDLDG